ncbi:uncharacterized protein A4U43_UnF11980 [Asparagus officinalis]|uniref:Uncharacterized protein n=1 Tax=Asparagus officinalis TaxID=4686 RepID=A0A1R3L559_ASPOF|nr:uncharacterized protein A4U43_UnF11980 [Asparagus officinalis]
MSLFVKPFYELVSCVVQIKRVSSLKKAACFIISELAGEHNVSANEHQALGLCKLSVVGDSEVRACLSSSCFVILKAGEDHVKEGLLRLRFYFCFLEFMKSSGQVKEGLLRLRFYFCFLEFMKSSGRQWILKYQRKASVSPISGNPIWPGGSLSFEFYCLTVILYLRRSDA